MDQTALLRLRRLLLMIRAFPVLIFAILFRMLFILFLLLFALLNIISAPLEKSLGKKSIYFEKYFNHPGDT